MENCTFTNCSNYTASEAPVTPMRDQTYRFFYILYALIAGVGMIGNGLVCFIVAKTRNGHFLSTEIFILSLAITDMLASLVVLFLPDLVIAKDSYPYPMNHLAVFCPVIGSQYLLFYFGFSSLYTMTAISLERWCAIAFPSRYRSAFKASNVKIIVICIWLLALLLPIDNLLRYVENKNGSTPCHFIVLNNDRNLDLAVYLSLEFIRVFIPSIIIIIAYSDVARRVWTISKSSQKNEPSNRDVRIRKKVTLMVCISAFVFLLSWLPNEIYFTLINFGLARLESIGHRSTKTLIILNSCLNPFIYFATNSKYRNTIKHICNKENTNFASTSYFQVNNKPGIRSSRKFTSNFKVVPANSISVKPSIASVG